VHFRKDLTRIFLSLSGRIEGRVIKKSMEKKGEKGPLACAIKSALQGAEQ